MESAEKIKHIAKIFSVTLANANTVERYLRGEVWDEELQEWPTVRQLYHYDRSYAIMLALNTLLGCYGVEGSSDYGYSYLNTGETYNETICYHEGKFFFSSWGDLQEILESTTDEP